MPLAWALNRSCAAELLAVLLDAGASTDQSFRYGSVKLTVAQFFAAQERQAGRLNDSQQWIARVRAVVARRDRLRFQDDQQRREEQEHRRREEEHELKLSIGDWR